MTAATESGALVNLCFEGQKYYPTQADIWHEDNDNKVFDKIKEWLSDYFQQKAVLLPDIPLDLRGTDFQKAIWKMMLDIPYGKTTTYKELAEKYANSHGIKSMSSQAVGNAVGRNPILVVIPCHRVLGTSGSLTGFAAGLDRKISLLELEKINSHLVAE